MKKTIDFPLATTEDINKLNEDLSGKLDNSTDVANKGKAVVVGEDGTLEFGDVATNVTQVSNPNLLDNGWFNVNSRGQSSYGERTQYIVDRWSINESWANVDVLDDHIILKGNTVNYYGGIMQYLSRETINNTKGKFVTISCLLKNYVAMSFQGKRCEINPDLHLFTARFVPDGSDRIKISAINSVPNDSHIIAEIYAIKLELGSVSTLHLDTPPNPKEEKLRCMLSTADPNDTFANKTLMNPISDEYNPAKIYEVDEMCINGNTLWKAKVQHSGQLQPTNGADENNYWKRTSVAKELTALNKTSFTLSNEKCGTTYKMNLYKVGRFVYGQFLLHPNDTISPDEIIGNIPDEYIPYAEVDVNGKNNIIVIITAGGTIKLSNVSSAVNSGTYVPLSFMYISK